MLKILLTKLPLISKLALKSKAILYNSSKILNFQKPIASKLKISYIENLLYGKIIIDTLKNMSTFLFFIWDCGSILGLFSFTITMLIVAYDIQSYVVSYVSMAIPFLPTSMLTITLPYLIDFGLYTPDQSWLEFYTSYLVTGYNNTLYYTSYIFNPFYIYIFKPFYNCMYYMFQGIYYFVSAPFYIIYYPWLIISTTFYSLTKLFFWFCGSLTILLGIKLWAIWDAVINEANVMMVNLNLTNNPVPAYLMAILYQLIIRPGQMVITTGSQYIIDYFISLLPTITESYDLLIWMYTGITNNIYTNGSLLWIYWLAIGHFITFMSIYPISLAGTIIDPVQIFLWFNFSILDHGILRPALFLGTGVFTTVGRILGIFF